MLTVYKNVEELLRELTSADNPYHQTHLKRYGRTLSVLLDEQPTEGKLLEIGTSYIIPIALKELVPNLQVHVTDYDLSKPIKGTLTITNGERVRKVPVYRLNVETTAFPVDDETFDYVLCSEVIEHMEQDPMFMMAEINRVMKPGGTLILTTPNVTSARGITEVLHNREPYFYMQYRKAGTLDRHNYEYSLSSISQVMKASGFTGTGWTENTFSLQDERDVLRLRAMGYPLAHVGDNIFCVAEKSGPVVNRYPPAIYVD